MDEQLLQRLTQRQKPNLVEVAGNFAKNLVKPELAAKENDQDLVSKLRYKMLENEATRDPLNDQLKRSQITALDAMSTDTPPDGFIRAGGKIVQDPNHLNALDQQKLDDSKNAEINAAESLRSSAQENLKTIQDVKKGAKYFGPLGNMPSIAAPSSLFGEYGPRKKWETNVDRLLSQKVIDVMAEMKRQSKTGASGFGALSQKELDVLQQASTALKKDLLPDDAMYYLNEMEKIHQKVLNDSGNQQNQDPFNAMKPSGSPSFVNQQEQQPVVVQNNKPDYKSKYGLRA